MSKLTLQDYMSTSINDLFMAVIVEQPSEAEKQQYLESLTPQDEDYKILKKATRIRNALMTLSAGLLRGTLSLHFEKTAPVIVLKYGDAYFNVGDDQEIDMTTHELRQIEPFSDYYSENEYRFIEMNGRVVMDVDSTAPWEKYINKVKKM